jgi:hypothetical protein
VARLRLVPSRAAAPAGAALLIVRCSPWSCCRACRLLRSYALAHHLAFRRVSRWRWRGGPACAGAAPADAALLRRRSPRLSSIRVHLRRPEHG